MNERLYEELKRNCWTNYNPFIKWKYPVVNIEITNVIYNDPATIVFWSDGDRTVVKCQDGDVYDPEKGLAMAICKKTFGNHGNYYNVFSKWLPEENEEDCPIISSFQMFKKNIEFLYGDSERR